MKYIGIDLSLSHSGIAVLNEDNSILKVGEIIPIIKNRTIWNRITETIDGLSKYLEGENEVCIEDVFFGVNAKASKDALRLSGALMYYYYVKTSKVPTLLMATSARKLAGLSSTCLKTETQLFILQRFNLCKEDRLSVYKVSVNSIKKTADEILIPLVKKYKETKDKKEKETIKEQISVVKNEYRKSMMKVSREIEKEFDLSEHKADALLLAIAMKRYHEAVKEI